MKSVFVTFMSDANVAPFRYTVSQGGERNTIVATADYYQGPFGTVMIHPNRVQAGSAKLARNAYFLDTDAPPSFGCAAFRGTRQWPRPATPARA